MRSVARERAEDVFPIERKVLREQVKDYLIDAIVKGIIPAGERIVETRIARQLGVSQAPVREAIRELDLMGLVETEPFRGSYVRKLSRADLEEVYAVRANLEGMAASIAARKMGDDDLAELSRVVTRMEEAAARGDLRGMIAEDVRFHEKIVEAAGNRFLMRLWTIVRMANWTFVTTRLAQDRLSYLAQRHRDVLRALETRDPQAAEQAMRDHIEQLSRYVVVED